MKTKTADQGERVESRWFMSEREVSAALGVSPSTMTRLNQRGELPEGLRPVYVGHRRVYPRAAVEKLAGLA